MYKIIGGDGQIYGPVSAETIREWIASRRATSNTQVQAEGSTEWRKLGELAEFKDALPNVASVSATGVPPQIQGFDGTRPSGTMAGAPTSGLATASLVLGIVGCAGITALVGLALGIVALVKIDKSQGRLGGRGLAIAGICVSAVMLVFGLPTMAGLLLPALAKAKQRAQSINCMNNLRQLGVAARTYAQSSGDRLPYATNWCDVLQQHVGGQNVFYCPAEKSQLCGYGYNAALSGLVVSEVDPLTVMFFEIPGGWNVSGGPEQMLQERRHGPNLNVVFADGSARQMTLSVLQNQRWDP
jgi:prepilin-type processing-associated H-X9-DG protein